MRFFTFLSLLLLTACGSMTPPPQDPPGLSEPPEVTTTDSIKIVVFSDIPMKRPELRAFLLEEPFTTFFASTDSIAAPVSWEPLRGTWLQPGSARRMQLEDGHFVVERVLSNEPEHFKYQIWVFTNAAGRGIEQIVGEQRFIELDNGQTRFEWTYHVQPKSKLTRFFVQRRVTELTNYMQNATDRMAAAATNAASHDSTQ